MENGRGEKMGKKGCKKAEKLSLYERYANNCWTGKEVQHVEKEKREH